MILYKIRSKRVMLFGSPNPKLKRGIDGGTSALSLQETLNHHRTLTDKLKHVGHTKGNYATVL